MNTVVEKSLHPSIDQVADFLQSYCDCIDEERFDEWCDFFTDDGRYRVTTAENLRHGYPIGLIDCIGKGMMRDRILGLQKANVFEPHTYRHMLSIPRVMETGANGVRVKTSFMVTRTMQGSSSAMFVTGHYDDLLVSVAGGLRFRSRLAVVDASRIDALIVLPL
jgi:anthranilate 1,2-dioxygenase small subunit